MLRGGGAVGYRQAHRLSLGGLMIDGSSDVASVCVSAGSKALRRRWPR